MLAIRARADVSLDRGRLARRQDLQDVGARQLGSFAPVQVWARAHWLMADPRARPKGNANCFSPPTDPAATCSISPRSSSPFAGCMGNARFAYPPKRQMRALGLVRGGGERKKRSVLSRRQALSASNGINYFLSLTRRDHRTVVAIWTDHAAEALHRRVSLVLVTRTQVQPVSLQTRSSPAPGAP